MPISHNELSCQLLISSFLSLVCETYHDMGILDIFQSLYLTLEYVNNSHIELRSNFRNLSRYGNSGHIQQSNLSFVTPYWNAGKKKIDLHVTRYHGITGCTIHLATIHSVFIHVHSFPTSSFTSVELVQSTGMHSSYSI